MSAAEPDYQNRTLPFINHYVSKNTQVKTHNLIDKFLYQNLSKVKFKDQWRQLSPGTDEHVSTQTVFKILDTIRTNKLHVGVGKQAPQIDPVVLKNNLTVMSHFRLPTEYTGHDSGKNVFAHPHSPGKSLSVPGRAATLHGTFDQIRRKVGHDAGNEAHTPFSKTDGTKALLSVLVEAAKFTINFIASTDARDVKTQPSISKQIKSAAFDAREYLKEAIKQLSFSAFSPARSTLQQVIGSPQFAADPSPAEKSLYVVHTPGGLVSVRARSLSPARR